MKLERVRAIFCTAVLVSSAIGLYACRQVPPKDSPTPHPASQLTRPAGNSYRLNRKVYRVELSSIPLARTRCWLTSNGTSSKKVRYQDTHILEWDSNQPAPPVRHVSMRGEDGLSDVRCSSEALSTPGAVPAQGGTAMPGASYTYVFPRAEPLTPTAFPVKLIGNLSGPIGQVSDAGADAGSQAAAPRGAPPIEMTISYIKDADPDLSGVDAALTRNRSLDPLTPIATELLTAIAEVAVERAKTSATEVIRGTLKDTICQIRYQGDDSAELYFPLSKEDLKKRKTRQLALVLSRVCKVLDAVRVEDIVASSKVLVRSLSGDLTEYAFRYARMQANDFTAREFLKFLEPIVIGLIEGKAIGTERDFQAMLLHIGKIPIPQADAAIPQADAAIPQADAAIPQAAAAEARWWECGMGIGLAVVRECLRRDTCPAEQLLASLDSEFDKPGEQCSGTTAKIDQKWPELRSILSRSTDVLRPPPGTSANQTAKVATNILLDVLKTSPGVREAGAQQRRDFEPVRALINSVFDNDMTSGIIAASGLITSEIDKHCKAGVIDGDAGQTNSEDYCLVDASSAQVKKGIALLNGFVSYASTYKDGSREGEDGKTKTEREKLRHDERKKAMEQLIDAATDRSNRESQRVFSVGVGVGFSFVKVPTSKGRKIDPVTFNETMVSIPASGYPTPSLPVGFAFDRLPGSHYSGFHVQVSFLDLAQFASADNNGKVVTPKFENALFFGLQAGYLLGKPKYSVILGFELGYSPGMKFDDAKAPGVFRGGPFIGTYIPFFDFN